MLAQRKKDEERRSRRRRPGSSSIALSLSMVSPSLRIPAAARVFDPAINTRCPPPHAVVMRMRSRSRRSIAASASPPGDPSIRDPISLPSKEPPACASASFSLLFGHSPRSPPGPLTSADLMEASGDGLKVAYQGCPGAYSEAAAKKAYPSCHTVPCEYFETAFQVCCYHHHPIILLLLVLQYVYR